MQTMAATQATLVRLAQAITESEQALADSRRLLA
jgi:hypothetical protein